MKRAVQISVFCLFFSLLSCYNGLNEVYDEYNGVNLPWLYNAGGTGADKGQSVTTDASGNAYITGYFTGTVDFDPGAGTDSKTSNGGSQDIFLTKINADGTYGWTKQFGGTGEDRGQSVTTDASGNVYMTGYFNGTADFDPGDSTDTKTAGGTGNELFLTKINADGTYGWTKQLISSSSGSNYSTGFSIALDSTGNIFLTGYCFGTVNFGQDFGQSDSKSTGTTTNFFLTKINSDVTYGWTKNFLPGSGNGGTCRSVTLDGSGNAYITGSFTGTFDFNPGTGTDSRVAPPSYANIFLTKINADGSYGWTKTFGDSSSVVSNVGLSVTADSSGNLYITGYFGNTVNFAKDFSGTDNKTAASSYDIYITKINADATYGWTKTFAGATGVDEGRSVAVDGSGNVYLAGDFTGTINFAGDFSGSDSKTAAGDSDIFLTKISSDGTYGWTRTLGSTGADGGLSVKISRFGNIFLTGYFSGPVDFDLGTGIESITTAGGNDIFLLKLVQ